MRKKRLLGLKLEGVGECPLPIKTDFCSVLTIVGGLRLRGWEAMQIN